MRKITFEISIGPAISNEIGRFLVNAIPAAALLRIAVSRGEGIETDRTADNFQWKNTLKGTIEQGLLEKRPGRHVILVRHTAVTNQNEEWVYNPADIDAAPVIWAQDLGEPENERLRRYYAERYLWLFKPNESMNLTPY